jgi:predicted nucleotidyltransferase
VPTAFATLTPDEYIKLVLRNHSNAVSDIELQTALSVVVPHIREWAGKYLLEISISGSHAKGTAVGSGSDIDLFVSISPEVQENLKLVYLSLYNWLLNAQLSPRQQNVSIGLTVNGIKIDLVPAKRQTLLYGTDHSLYLRKQDSWRKTNIVQHVNYVVGSGRVEEIRAIKCWRDCHRLEFPTINVELAVIIALNDKPLYQLGENVWTVLEFLAGKFVFSRLVDPANSNNIISDDMTGAEKTAVMQHAKKSLQAANWNQILW